jgi:hypothetical protein
MFFVDGGVILLILWVACLADVIITDADRVRNLPKIVWLLIVLILPDIGSILWLIAGHPWESRREPVTRAGREFPEYDRPGRHIAQNPEDDEEFLRKLRERADEQRRKADEQRREREARGEPEPF